MTRIPEIKFYTSPVYEGKWWDFRLTKPPKINEEQFLQSVNKIRARKQLFQEYLRDITRILGIEWSRKEIEVWMVSLSIGVFSRPLTLSLCWERGKVRDIDHLIDDLTHELIHNALIEHPRYSEALKLLEKDYAPEPFRTYVHILVHAVHVLIYKTKRGEHRMEWDIQKAQSNQPYARAWEIVQKEGPEKILEKYLGSKN